MNKITLSLALIASLATAAVPGSAAAAEKKKPKKKVTPIYKIAGDYTHTSTIFTRCHPGTGGTVETIQKSEKYFLYSGDTKKGFTIKSREDLHQERRVMDNEYIRPYQLSLDPTFRTVKIPGSAVLQVEKGKGWISYDGVEAENTRESFKLPAKKGKSEKFVFSTDLNSPGEPTASCPVSTETNSITGTLTITRVN